VIVDGKPLVQQWLACELKNQGPLTPERVARIAAAAERQRRQLESVSTGAARRVKDERRPASAPQQRRHGSTAQARQDRRAPAAGKRGSRAEKPATCRLGSGEGRVHGSAVVARRTWSVSRASG